VTQNRGPRERAFGRPHPAATRNSVCCCSSVYGGRGVRCLTINIPCKHSRSLQVGGAPHLGENLLRGGKIWQGKEADLTGVSQGCGDDTNDSHCFASPVDAVGCAVHGLSKHQTLNLCSWFRLHPRWRRHRTLCLSSSRRRMPSNFVGGREGEEAKQSGHECGRKGESPVLPFSFGIDFGTSKARIRGSFQTKFESWKSSNFRLQDSAPRVTECGRGSEDGALVHRRGLAWESPRGILRRP